MIGKEDFLKMMDDFVKRWPTIQRQLDVYYSHLRFMDSSAFQEICNRFIEDFRAMPLVKDFKEAYSEWKKEKPIERDPIGKPKFEIRFYTNCRLCEKKNTVCISEPMGSDWQCRQCYTGYTDKQIKDKLNNIYKNLSMKVPF